VSTEIIDYEEELVNDMATFYLDPYGFAVYAFAWGQADLLNKFLDKWQIEELQAIRDELALTRGNPETADDPLFYATKAGHGVGKSAIIAIIMLWLMSTRPHFAGVVTANTKEQLIRKTWRELAVWHSRCITQHWFSYNATSFHHVKHTNTWRIDATPWSEHNSEAFAGLHNGGRGQAMIFDEASNIADIIWEVGEGAMSDPDAFWLVFGNPTRRTGRFADCWGRFARRWKKFTVNAMHAASANKRRIREQIEDWGIDSDYIRVRVLGEFPEQDVATLIPADWLDRALTRRVEGCEQYRPVWGLDVSRFGDDRTCLVKRRSRMLMEPATVWRGLNLMQTAERVRQIWADTPEDEKPAAICVDAIGVGAGVVDRLNEMAGQDLFGDCQIIGINVSESASVNDIYQRFRDEIFWRARKWFEALNTSMIMDTRAGSMVDIDDDEDIIAMLDNRVARESPITDELRDILYAYLPNGKIKLESKQDTKDRLGKSPDLADGFVLTFGFPDVVMPMADNDNRRYSGRYRGHTGLTAWSA
jgi:hypothetical protein